MTEISEAPEIYPHSVVQSSDTSFYLARGKDKVLGVLGDTTGFEGAHYAEGKLLLCPLTPANAVALRARLPWLRPVTLGLQTSVGFGDRLGLATPGHVQAVRDTGIAPIFAQQSVRENARTGRTPQQVLDDATWGAFREGWRGPWGADADHLKTPEDVDAFVAAGFTFYTIDPGAHVDDDAHADPPSVVTDKVAGLPWDVLESSPVQLRRDFLAQTFLLGDLTLAFDEGLLFRAAAKYGRAVAHVVTMTRYLAARAGDSPFEVEVSVDETQTPTSVHEHFYIARELRRLGVSWVSLGPRFVGRFEKGVDYIGDLAEFEADVARHLAVVRYFGGYKLSLHTGSDKFSIYSIVARHAGPLVHLKTAGTSYLEALRAISWVEPELFREILRLARSCYEVDRATYHVSARLRNVPLPDDLTDADLPALLDQPDARQVLHVTYGSVLDRFSAQLRAALEANEEAYEAALERHFRRHLAPFTVVPAV